MDKTEETILILTKEIERLLLKNKELEAQIEHLDHENYELRRCKS
jgi:cell division protein FtsB